MWECLHLDLLLSNLNLKFLPYLHVKRKKENNVSVAYFSSYFQYAWVITIFYNRFNNWIIDVIWDRVAVSIFCNFEVTYNIGKEGIRNLCFTFSLDTILSDKNGLMVFQKVLLSVTFFFFVKINIIQLLGFSKKRHTVVPLFWNLSFNVIISISQKFISESSSLHYFFGKGFICKWVSDFLLLVSACKVHANSAFSYIYQENLKNLHFHQYLHSKVQTAIPL